MTSRWFPWVQPSRGIISRLCIKRKWERPQQQVQLEVFWHSRQLSVLAGWRGSKECNGLPRTSRLTLTMMMGSPLVLQEGASLKAAYGRRALHTTSSHTCIPLPQATPGLWPHLPRLVTPDDSNWPENISLLSNYRTKQRKTKKYQVPGWTQHSSSSTICAPLASYWYDLFVGLTSQGPIHCT